MEDQSVGSKTEDHLRGEYDPMPFMEAQIEGIYLTKGKKEHKKDEPGEGWLEGKKDFIAKGSDEHAEPEGITVKEFFHI